MKALRVALLAGLLAGALLGGTAGGVAAYGAADQPLAQIELSANCNNQALCTGPFGLGGVWLWIEIDADGTGDIAGAGCEHFIGGPGFADPIRGEITWTGPGLAGFPIFIDPNGKYYNVTFGGDVISFPQTVGHYSWHPAPGVTYELQVAP